MDGTITQQLNSSIQRSMIEKDQLIEELRKENDFLRKQLFEDDGCTVFIALNNGREIFCKFKNRYEAEYIIKQLFEATDKQKLKIECMSGIHALKCGCVETAFTLKAAYY